MQLAGLVDQQHLAARLGRHDRETRLQIEDEERRAERFGESCLARDHDGLTLA
jgi:hypothetical protein